MTMMVKKGKKGIGVGYGNGHKRPWHPFQEELFNE